MSAIGILSEVLKKLLSSLSPLLQRRIRGIPRLEIIKKQAPELNAKPAKFRHCKPCRKGVIITNKQPSVKFCKESSQEVTEIKNAYADAGVNIDTADLIKSKIARQAKSTYRPEVLSGVGFFGGLFEFKGYKNPVLVSSTDGVGTKLKISSALSRYNTVGIDIVNHCVNDIFTSGAEPLFFLDYIAMGKLIPERIEAIVQGMVRACREAGCALIGGETAEMPGLYSGDDYDLVGFIIGAIEKDRIVMGQTVAVGDVAIGLPSSGLHTNGYSLVRKIFSTDEMTKYFPELGRTLGDVLLEPHRCYYHPLKPLLPLIKGMAHITGGGLLENVPRIVPDGMAVRFNRQSWEVPPVFGLIQKRGNVSQSEMFRVFNMGIGMVVICSPEKVTKLTESLPDAKIVGEVVKQPNKDQVIIK